jgi:hypothetical protein
MKNLYVKNVYLPDTRATKVSNTDTLVPEPEVQQVQHTVAANDVPSARDRVHKSELELVQVQWNQYQHHLERMGKVQNRGEGNAPWIYGLMMLHPLDGGESYNLHRRITVRIKKEKYERYTQLYQKLCALEARKQIEPDREEGDSQLSVQPTVGAPVAESQEKGDNWWARHMPAMGYLHETPAKVDNKSTPEQSAAKETAMSPAEKQVAQREGVEPIYSHSEEEYQLYLNAVEEGRISPKIHNIWLVMAHKLRLGGHRPYLRGGTALTSCYLKYIGAASTLTVSEKKVEEEVEVEKREKQKPSKLLGKYTVSTSEALVYAGTIQSDLHKKQREIDEYLRYVGGLGAFNASAGGILVPQKIEVDEDLPWD